MNYLDELDYESPQYDFVGLIKAHYEKVSDRNILNIFWNQLTKNEPENVEGEKISEYRDHLPVNLCNYVKILELRLSELPKENLQVLDGIQKTYLLTFIYFCTKTDANVTDRTKVTASCLYLNLTMFPEVGKLFFNEHLYTIQMYASTLIITSSDIPVDQKEVYIKLVKQHCLQENHLNHDPLAASANVIVVSMIITASKEMVKSGRATGLTEYCMKAMRIIILHTSNHNLIKVILRRLFRCIIKSYAVCLPNPEIAVDIVILFIKGTLEIKAFERKIELFLTSFSDHWASPEFQSYKVAVKIMNIFPEEQYKDLLRKMITYSEAHIPKTLLINVFNLTREIFITPPPLDLEKISVLYSCILRNIIIHGQTDDQEIVAFVIDIIAEICEATTNPLHKHIFSDVRAKKKVGSLDVESILLGLYLAADETWSPKNKKLFIILTRFAAVTPQYNPGVIEEVLGKIIKDATPATFEDSLDILLQTFLTIAARDEAIAAELFLEIIHNFALTPRDSLASKYAEIIFEGMLKPTTTRSGKTYPTKCFHNIYLRGYFNYEDLFRKCHHLIGEREINLAIQNLDYTETSSAVLLCCLLKHYDYTRINTLVSFMLENFTELAGYEASGFICSALETILRNRNVTDLDYPQLDAVQSSIMQNICARIFPVPSLAAAFSLYKLLRRLILLPDDEDQLNQLVSETTAEVVLKIFNPNHLDNNCILYLSEICLLLNKMPSDQTLAVIENALDSHNRLQVIKTRNTGMYISLMSLFCTFGMLSKKRAILPMKYLTENLGNRSRLMRASTINLLYSLCKEITHEFKDIIAFAFNEMIVGNACLVRICSSILEELIHDDYFKPTAQEFFRFVYVVGSTYLNEYVEDIFARRFAQSNQNDITKYYMQTVMYVNMYGKFPDFPIPRAFYTDLNKIRRKLDNPMQLYRYLIKDLPINKKFNILMEICKIFEDVLRGQCKVDENFYNVLLHLIATVKLLTPATERSESKYYYQNVIKQVEKQIVRFDPSAKKEQYYKEYENEIRKFTVVFLKVLFLENQTLASKIQKELFDALINWIDYMKDEFIYYIHEERGKEYDPYFNKLVLYYKKNKNMFQNCPR